MMRSAGWIFTGVGVVSAGLFTLAALDERRSEREARAGVARSVVQDVISSPARSVDDTAKALNRHSTRDGDPQIVSAPDSNPAPDDGTLGRVSAPTETDETADVASRAPDGPLVDVLRVERDGQTLVSGRATPGAVVDIVLDGAPIGSGQVDGQGGFVAFLDIPQDTGPRQLALRMRQGGDMAVEGAQTFVVEPRAGSVARRPTELQPATRETEFATVSDRARPTEPTGPAERTPKAASLETDVPDPAASPSAPRVLLLDGSGLSVLQDGPQDDALSIDTIAYETSGTAVLGGRAPDDVPVRIYLDNRPLDTTQTQPDGQWSLDLPKLASQVYTLRVDQLNPDGSVAARAETPFRPEPPRRIAEIAAGLDEGLSRVTVQPGYTLWGIAEERYGDGLQFVKVFAANAGAIRDPDLIFPGQIFEVPQ